MKKILLLQPTLKAKNKAYRAYSPSLGVLSNFLKSEFEVTILDLLVEEKRLENIELESFDVIAMTLLTPAVPSARKILQKIKSISKRIPVIAGGPHATFLPEDAFANGFDYVVSGRTGSDINQIFQNILGSFPQEKIFPGRIPNGEDLSICIDYFDLSKYTEHIFFTSIGCQYKCIFCSNNSFSVYERKFDKLFFEISYALSKKKMPIFFSDDIFIPYDHRLTTFCDLYSKKIGNNPFTVQMRVDGITPKRVEALADAGCVRIILGVESGSDSSLKIFNKKITQTGIIRAIKTIENAGIYTRMNYIVGMLGDGMPENNLSYIAESAKPSEISIHQLIPFPGSSLWENPGKYGIQIKNKYNFGEYNFSSISDNFIYESLGRRSTREVIEACIDKLLTIGYREPSKSNQGPFLVTPLSSIRFSH